MWFNQLLIESWNVLRESAAYILLGFLIAAGLHVVLAKTDWARWLKGLGIKSILRASAIGLPLPLCSCSVLPAALSLRKKGAGKGATLSFLISTPETSIQSVLLTYALLGPIMAVYRPLAACVTALIAGLTENFFEKRYPTESAATSGDAPTADDDAPSCCHNQPADPHDHSHDQPADPPDCCHDQPPDTQSCCDSAPDDGQPDCCHQSDTPTNAAGGSGLWRDAMRHAFVDIFDDVVGWMLFGVVFAAVIGVLVPGFLLDAVFGPPLQSMLIMLVIGIPLYICAEGSTPMAAALILKGVNPGAALVFLLAGPATNIGSVGLLVRQLGRRTVVIYLASISIVSVLMGAGLNLFFDVRSIDLSARAMSAPLLPDWAKTAGAILFVLLALGTMHRKRVIPRWAGWLDRRLPVRVTAGRLSAAAIIATLPAYGATGLFTVQPGQAGIIKRFGRIVDAAAPPGLHYHWPYPFGAADCIDTRLVHRLVLGSPLDTSANPESANPESANPDQTASWVLLGDENIANIACAVQWRMVPGQVIRFAYATADRAALVTSAVQSALRQVLGGANIDTVFTTDQDRLAEDISRATTNTLDRCDSGIELVSFSFLDLHAPPPVHTAFRDVASALEDQSRLRNEAMKDKARIIPLAQGAGQRTILDAKAYLYRTVAGARGRSAAFLAQLDSYKRFPELTRWRLLYETYDRVFPGIKKCIRPDTDRLMLDLRYNTAARGAAQPPL